jgi:carboxymethylenebutenolidase
VTDGLEARANARHDRFTHGGDRRAFLADLVKLAGSAAAANALLAGIAASPAAAAIIPADDPRLKTATVRQKVSEGRVLSLYMAVPAKAHGPHPAVMVVHENKGLDEHIRDVARRVALAGYVACAPDFLTVAGGTPADEDTARRMIGRLDLVQTTLDALACVQWLGRNPPGNQVLTGKVGALGFCWGGALVDRTAVAAGTALAAGVSYYGPAPDPTQAAQVRAAMLLHYASLDTRVTPDGLAWANALAAAGVATEAHVYEGVNHAFDNDTAPDRYDAAAAGLAWTRTLAFLAAHLAPKHVKKTVTPA